MSGGDRDGIGLGARAAAAFEALFGKRPHLLHPEDRAEAEAFWAWLGQMERPALESDCAPRSSPWRVVRFAVAAAACVAALLLSANWLAMERPETGLHERFASGRAERRAIRLIDGSVVTLAADSMVDVHYLPSARRIRLERGEALFDVAHNRARPFIVEVPHGEIKAVGTAFDVRLGRENASVTVVEGVIRIALPTPAADGASGEPIIKEARKGEQVRFGVSQRGDEQVGIISQTGKTDVELATAWTRGLLVFRGEPLEEVIATVNRYSRDTVTLTDPSQARIPVYGVVNQGDTAALRDLIRRPESVEIQANR